MPLDNYHELAGKRFGADAGFQYEFYCAHCSRTWRSPFKPYRKGQFASLLSRVSFLLGPVREYTRFASDASVHGERKAKAAALAEAQELASELFRVCPSCDKPMCGDCLGERDEACAACRQKAPAAVSGGGRPAAAAAPAAAAGCPNCGAPRDGGRFCAECGFDMAAMFKSCPACSAQLPRQARYCTDCGHAF